MAKASPRTAGITRERLIEPFAGLWEGRLGLVVAPAGSGKSTLLAHIAERSRAPVAWYRAEDVDADPAALLTRLQQSLGTAVGPFAEPWESVDMAVRALARPGIGRVLLVVDDLHALEGTDAERALGRLVDRAPARLAVIVASRLPPAWNISRRRVAGQLVEVAGDDLRFRSWEVERLFRDHYTAPLAPDDLAALTRHTDGWVAGLQLFHLATQKKSALERRRMVASLGSHMRLVREYLVANVLDELPRDLRDFLLETCVLGRLCGELCDELRGTSGSRLLLDELERRQLLSVSSEDGRWFRAHEVLRAHLESASMSKLSGSEMRSRYRWAGSLLEAAGALSDALLAYSRAEDSEAAGRLLGRKGQELTEGPLGWIEWLPPALLHHDPWLLLAEARRQRSAGRWSEAVATYQRAEKAMAAGTAADICRRERISVLSWLAPAPVPSGDWLSLLRTAVTADPMVVHHQTVESQEPELMLVAGLAALAAACPTDAVPALARAVDHPGISPVLSGAARLALAAALLLGGQDGALVEQAAEELELAGLPGLARMTPALLGLAAGGDGGRQAAGVREACRGQGDVWGEPVAALLQGWAGLRSSVPVEAVEALEAASGGFRGLGAEVLAALASSLEAVAAARGGLPRSKTRAGRAEAAGRILGSPGAQALATLALAEADPDAGEELRSEASRLLQRCGLVVPGAAAGHAAPAAPVPGREHSQEPPRPVVVRSFRGFALHLHGQPVDLSGLKPRARKLLRLLVMHCPDWVHREVLMEALWAQADPVAGARNLHVAVSSLRHLLEPGAGRGGSLIARQGDAYRLALPPGAWVDHIELSRALERARAALGAGDAGLAERELGAALLLAPGPFLPEDGPDDWVVARRDHYRAEGSHAAQALADILVAAGRLGEAAEVCERGLAADRCSDGLWRRLVAVSEAAGHAAAAARARREYASVLAGLGVPYPPGQASRSK